MKKRSSAIVWTLLGVSFLADLWLMGRSRVDNIKSNIAVNNALKASGQMHMDVADEASEDYINAEATVNEATAQVEVLETKLSFWKKLRIFG